MKAVTCQDGEFEVRDVAAPVPGPGQLVLDVRRCGICGSDLHARRHGDEMADVLTEIGYPDFGRVAQPVVFGHEFAGVVAGHGPQTRGTLPVGTPVVSVPLVRRGEEVHALGLSQKAPGAYAQQVLVQESLTLKIPNGLALDTAALTEPMAVAWHAVARGDVTKKDVAIVIGCGPVGLSVICVLKARGVKTIIASDFSPGRRALAARCGADVVIDPATDSPYASAGEHRHMVTMPQVVKAGMDGVDGMSKLPLPWWHTWRLLDKAGLTTPKAPVVFECVGVPGMIDGVIAGAPLYSRVVVVGVCMGDDTIRPSLAINKETDLRFVVGYTPLEFRDTLHALGNGKIDAAALVTGVVGLSGVDAAFGALADPEVHAKILIDPGRDGAEVAGV